MNEWIYGVESHIDRSCWLSSYLLTKSNLKSRVCLHRSYYGNEMMTSWLFENSIFLYNKISTLKQPKVSYSLLVNLQDCKVWKSLRERFRNKLRDSKDSAECNWTEVWWYHGYLDHFIFGNTFLNTKRDTFSLQSSLYTFVCLYHDTFFYLASTVVWYFSGNTATYRWYLLCFNNKNID